MVPALSARLSAAARVHDAQSVGLTLIVKLAIFSLGGVAATMAGAALVEPRDLLTPWNRWDAPHYLDIAVFGYRAVDPGDLFEPGYQQVYPGDLDLYIVFYPLFPALVALANTVLDDPLVSAFAVTGLASLFVGPLLYRVVAIEYGPGIGLAAVWFCLIFPTAYFLHLGYTEALFLALALGCLLAARVDRWWLAGGLGALAALTRVNGLVLIPTLAVEAWLAWRALEPGERRVRVAWVGAVALVVLGFVAYLGLNHVVYGDAFAFARIQREHWFKSPVPPWEAIANSLRWVESLRPEDAVMYVGVELAFVALGLLAVAAAVAVRMRASWVVWAGGNWLLMVSTSLVLSVPRYLLVVFPIYVLLARLTRGRPAALGAVSVVSGAGLLYFATRFAAGAWAF
ncbi:MAG TPA: hypothetical protein VHK06_02575 [Candidatus Limnocylindria bacterium]|nr:hypothetical protein [Candidatus Limnocylindria bacterium]